MCPAVATERMCLRKRAHLSRIGAEIALNALSFKRRVALRTYRCPNCTFWHLTSKPLKGASRPKSRPVMTRKQSRS